MAPKMVPAPPIVRSRRPRPERRIRPTPRHCKLPVKQKLSFNVSSFENISQNNLLDAMPCHGLSEHDRRPALTAKKSSRSRQTKKIPLLHNLRFNVLGSTDSRSSSTSSKSFWHFDFKKYKVFGFDRLRTRCLCYSSFHLSSSLSFAVFTLN